ncbi:type VI secretion system Vgr family protein [Flavobacterium sp. IB48]|uniref:type VI secretion system Vgr family protein n=1 Tax=Flavobacterium sp. IB48 TaxID=2779375 RepID=UPI0018E9084D|nr:phage baseplate assembly protein V [Flavobacterium sp. IB48]MBJ2122854.1 type IV secretion protein Rhs [Flavobacterium sp. IB48]
MALQTVTTIKVGEIQITNFSGLEIIQTIHDHHSFSFQVRQDLLVEQLRSVMPFSQQLYGEKISIEIKPIDGLEDFIIGADPNDYVLQFYGVVTEVQLQKSRIKDMEETILIKGHSSTIILENGPECNSFISMPLADIVNKVKEGVDIDMDVRPFYKDSLPYTVQYNESSFSFLNRLAKRNGQWLYYNGRTTIFGTPGGVGGQPKLVYGVNMQDFNYTMKLIPAMFKTIENDNREGEYRTDETLNYQKETDGFQQNFLNKGNRVFNKETVIQLNQNPVGGYVRTTSEEYTKNKMRAVLSRLMEVTASSEVPGITIGNKVRISGVDMQLESSYRVTHIRHICDDGGGYENQFTAINFNNSVFSSETDPDLVPYCQSQTAIVTANADPDGLSSVQVQMPWQEAKGQTTPYIPLMQNYGGDARGSHIIPEIGDTVFVDFQGNNAELPIVIGTMTSRKEKSGYSTPNNDLKVMKTRSGITATFNDANGSVSLEDPSGNKYFMDGNGNTTIDAPKNLTINAGENISINAGQNMDINVGVHKTDIIGGNYTQSITGSKFLAIGIDFMTKVMGNLTEFIKGNRESETGERKEIAKTASLISTEEHINVHASKNLNKYSGENSINS